MQAYELHVRKPSFLVGLGGRYTENIFAEHGLPRSTFREIVQPWLNNKQVRQNMALGSWVGPVDPISAEGSVVQSPPPKLSVAMPARLRLVEELMRALAKLQSKPRWGFKILTDFRYTQTYFEVFPGSKLVFLIRDPRDHAVSVLALNEQRASKNQRPFYIDEIAVAHDWVDSIRNAESLHKAFENRVTLITYEYLVSRPDDAVKVLSEKLYIDLSGWSNAHLGPETRRHAQRFLHHSNLSKPIQGSSVGRWRRELTPQQTLNIMEAAEPEMERFGYT